MENENANKSDEKENTNIDIYDDEEMPCSSTKLSVEEQEDTELAQVLTAEEYLMRPEVKLLDYEKQMFLDMVNADALMVCAKGLSYDKVLLNILNVYSDAGNLILIINYAEWEEGYYKQHIDSKFLHEVATTATERERVYLEGGIQFISTRILVVDLLKQRIPIELITGIIVLRAHTIIESCQEAFALRLYRQHNKTGFIKAFSNSPESFTIGYNHIERIMRNLFVKELFIWPRFHAIVQKCLKSNEAKTIELHIPLSDKMKLIQTSILDVMNYLVREIKRINRFIDMEEITVENCVTKKFHKILQAQLDCIWHQLNTQTKLIVADLKILRNLMISTMYNDAVSAYALTKRYRTKEYALSNSGWTLLDVAEQIFKLAKDRVYNEQGEFQPEPCPKWKYLSELLKVEIPGDWKRTKNQNNLEQPKVLILCHDSRTCFQLQQYLIQSGERYLLYMAMQQQVPIGKLSKKFEKIPENLEIELTQKYNRTLKGKDMEKSLMNKTKEPDKSDKEGTATQIDDLLQLLTQVEEDEENQLAYQENYVLTMTQMAEPYQQEVEDKQGIQDEEGSDEYCQNQSVFEPFPELDNLDITEAVAVNKQPLICLQTFKTARESSKALDRVLNDIQPHYVIMYHCNVTAIRQLEIYEARQCRPSKDRIKVFFLIHNQTVEEQSYLTNIRREKQAFEFIIETKSKMVIPEYQDGKSDEAFILYKSYKDTESEETDNTKSRKAGGQSENEQDGKTNITPKIIVDMREFRSDLPCLIHKRGLEVVPVTITIGDYILTPEICVERKSISDLIGSLNSGRLYNQCIQMQRYYAKPILLIEFDQNKPFHLQGKYMLSQNTTATNTDIVQKLQLLTIHFPRLRLIWSPSPYATAQLFEELKCGKPEPDPKQAALVGANNDDDGGVRNCEDFKYFNNNIYDFLLRLPGITTRNIHKLMRHGCNLRELLKKSETELSELLDSVENARLLWNILHVIHLPEKDEIPGSTAMLTANRQIGTGAGRHSRFRRNAAAAVAARITPDVYLMHIRK